MIALSALEQRQQAIAWFAKSGWRVLAHDKQTRWGTIDLIVRRGPLVVFVHVGDTPDQRGKSRLRRAAVAWIGTNEAQHRGAIQFRFDVVTVTDNGIEKNANAF